MAKDATKPTKARAKSRTIEEQIADLQAKADARAAKQKEVAQKKHAAAVAARDRAKARFEKAQANLDAIESALGSDSAS